MLCSASRSEGPDTKATRSVALSFTQIFTNPSSEKIVSEGNRRFEESSHTSAVIHSDRLGWSELNVQTPPFKEESVRAATDGFFRAMHFQSLRSKRPDDR